MKFLLLALVLLSACAGSNLRTQSRAVSDYAAIVIDAGTHRMLALYCAESMAAISRSGTLAGGRCRESGPRAGSPATEAETAALTALRTRWAPVLAYAETVTRVHDTLRELIQGGVAVADGQILVAIGELAAAYESMRRAAIAAGVDPPPPLVLGGAP